MTVASPAFRFTWLLWASAFLLPWALLFVARPAPRRRTLVAQTLLAPGQRELALARATAKEALLRTAGTS